jgi:hypothetical protein
VNTRTQERAYKMLRLGLIGPIPTLAVVIFLAVSESGSHHSVVRGLVATVIYLAVIFPVSIYILRKRSVR